MLSGTFSERLQVKAKVQVWFDQAPQALRHLPWQGSSPIHPWNVDHLLSFFASDSQCISTCWDVSISDGNAVCQNESWKEKSVYPFILCFVYRCVSRNKPAVTAPPQRCFFRGVLVSRFCHLEEVSTPMDIRQTTVPPNVSCFSPVLTTPYTLALASHFLALACNKSIL